MTAGTDDAAPTDATATDEAPRRASGRRLLLRFLESLALGFVLGFCLLAIAPLVLGWRPYTVLTGSMRPNIQPGDVVMDRPMKVSDADVGDVVTFSDPSRNGALVTHRIRSITRGPLQTDVETRGDANNVSERWSIKTTDKVGRVVYVIPKVGHVANRIKNHPAGILLLVVVPVLLVGVGVVRRIWQEEDEDEPAVEPAGEQQGADDRPDR